MRLFVTRLSLHQNLMFGHSPWNRKIQSRAHFNILVCLVSIRGFDEVILARGHVFISSHLLHGNLVPNCTSGVPIFNMQSAVSCAARFIFATNTVQQREGDGVHVEVEEEQQGEALVRARAVLRRVDHAVLGRYPPPARAHLHHVSQVHHERLRAEWNIQPLARPSEDLEAVLVRQHHCNDAGVRVRGHSDPALRWRLRLGRVVRCHELGESLLVGVVGCPARARARSLPRHLQHLRHQQLHVIPVGQRLRL
mmetsp:Transcript_35466/g.67946  ORF Transcript_35466/g.67946 Transcript_35466/m.67946 type:complete len:252 (-) Transcript_35466:877-1632(-)